MKNPPVSVRRGGDIVPKIVCEATECVNNSKHGCTAAEINIDSELICEDYEASEDEDD